jgi:hypothetical protein
MSSVKEYKDYLLNESKGRVVKVSDKMQKGYSYTLTAKEGDFSDVQKEYPEFKPAYTPKQMLAMGVFEGKYFRDCHAEFPASWFAGAKEAEGDGPDASLNKFGVKSRLNLDEWENKGWLTEEDPRGWAQWYFRFYYGRRDPELDDVQIKRWLGIKRHAAQVEHACKKGDLTCRPRQRQTLLQWSYKCDI